MSSSLPDDINALKRLLAEQEALNRALLEKLNEREREIDHLQAQLDKLRRMNFGSRSEKVSRRIAQMEADLNRLQKESDTLTGRVYDPAVQRPLRQTRTRKPFPESLPRDEKRLLPAAPCCPNCGGSLSYLGEDTAEQLELMRSAFRVIRTVREKHACTQCDAIVQAPAPSRPIERGIAGPGLLARVLTSKYAEHTPLYRQSEIYGRQGVELSRSLLSGWVDACCRLLSPLEEALQDYPTMKFLNCPLGRRKAFATSSGYGLGVDELKTRDPKAVKEVKDLVKAVFGDEEEEANAKEQ